MQGPLNVKFGRTPLVEWSAQRTEFWQHTSLTTDRHPCPRRDL